MKFEPHDYQKYAIDFVINNPYCGLFLDMGLGKSVITLTALKKLIAKCEVKKSLIIAPLRVAQTTWSSEIVKWEHLQGLKFSKILGTEQERINGANADADIYIINRENIKWLIDKCEKKTEVKWIWDTVVIDELSSFKNNSSQRFKVLRKVRPILRRIIGLTGTPAPNGYMDLWSQMYLLDMGKRLGKFITHFRKEHFFDASSPFSHYSDWQLKAGSKVKISEAISDICLSMQSADYIKMPERIDNKVYVALPPHVMQDYEEIKDKFLLEHPFGDIDAKNAAVLVNKLRQIASGSVYNENGNAITMHEEKLNVLEDLIEGANGKPVLILCDFTADKQKIIKQFNARTFDKASDIADWNEGKIEIAVAHPASCGHGLNLQQGGSTLIWYTLPWSLELYQQANARLYRQ